MSLNTDEEYVPHVPAFADAAPPFVGEQNQ